MTLNKLRWNNYMQFSGQGELSLSAINLLTAPNGVGKSNLLGMFYFVIWGYTGKANLSEVPTYGEKTCSVGLEYSYDNSIWNVSREVPSKITILRDGANVDPENKMLDTDKTNLLIGHFGKFTHFQQKRTVDGYDGTGEVNFLEKSDITIKKILFSGEESIINDVRQDFLNQKTERERLNRDKAVLYTCFPSTKRMEVLKSAITNITSKIDECENFIDKYQSAYNNFNSKHSQINGNKDYINNCNSKLQRYNTCPICKRQISDELKNKIISEQSSKIKELDLQLDNFQKEMVKYQTAVNKWDSARDKKFAKKEKLNELIMKLKSRLHNKDFIYTTQDVLDIKETIKWFDQVSSMALINQVKTLEPVINQVLKSINHSLYFDVSKTGKFEMWLKDNKEVSWKYHRLSCGQKLMVQIAIKVAILLEQGEDGIVICDEGAGGLDETNLNYILDFFNSLPLQLIFTLHRLDKVPNYVNIVDILSLRNLPKVEASIEETPKKKSKKKVAK